MAISPYRRFQINRRLRRVKRFFKEKITVVTDYFKEHVVERFSALREARRFAVGWLILTLLISGTLLLQAQHSSKAFIADSPVSGGTYIEGVVGKITNLNPIFATGRANSNASKLIFNGLFTYDSEGNLVPSLAEGYRVNSEGTRYEVTLKEGITFHDGQPLTARDVLFTVRAMKRPDTRSPFQASWRDIEVEAADDKTVVFKLPNAFSPFPHSLTVGILPAHLLEDVGPSDLRADSFNTNPVGTGPFVFESLSSREGQQDLELAPNPDYHRGKPRLDAFIVRSFEDYETMIEAYERAHITALSGLRTLDLELINSGSGLETQAFPMTSQVYLFFNNSKPGLKNQKIRKALTLFIDKKQLLQKTSYMFAPSQQPLLQEHLGYQPNLKQEFNKVQKANRLLRSAGFNKKNGFYVKNGNKLSFTVVTQSTDEYPEIAQVIQQQWEERGVKVNIDLVDPNDLQQGYIQPHAYEILLFGITLGADPDVFAYWHSSQSSQGGFNLAEYSSEIADEALEAGRTRLDKKIRAAKYQTFVKQWLKDNPAAVLYRPQYIYGHHPKFSGVLPDVMAEPSDRLNYVETWTIRQAPTERDFNKLDTPGDKQ